MLFSPQFLRIGQGWTNGSAAQFPNGANTAFTWTGSNVISNTNDRSAWSLQTFSGNFSIEYTWSINGLNAMFGLSPVSLDGSLNQNNGRADVLANGAGAGSAGTYTMYSQSSTTYFLAAGSTTAVSGQAATASDVMLWTRVGSTVSFFKNTSLVHAFATTSSAQLRMIIGTEGGATQLDLLAMRWKGGA
tara:strand:+ start:1905 stop:2471 length:567 start_codon:yes stop_codon:yes gene_type:complete